MTTTRRGDADAGFKRSAPQNPAPIVVPDRPGRVPTLVDLHAHNFATTPTDARAFVVTPTDTTLASHKRFQRLFNLSAYLGRSVVMGSFDGTAQSLASTF